MKENIKILIDKLADKSLTFGQRVRYKSPYLDEDAYIVQSYYAKGGKCYQLVAVDNKKRQGVQFLASCFAGDKGVEILGHPILIGDVLERIPEELWNSGNHYVGDGAGELIYLWKQCGLTKSLQQIFSQATWEFDAAYCNDCDADVDEPCEMGCVNESAVFQVPTQQPIRDLFQFLLDLNL